MLFPQPSWGKGREVRGRLHAFRQASGGKRQGRPLASVNNVAGQTKDCFLLHVTDTQRNELWLVDGGALLSIIPPTSQQRLQGPNSTKMKAANGSNIDCFGTTTRTITIGERLFEFEFIIADVQSRILGADFLAQNYLAPNHRDALIIDLKDYSTLPAQHARGFKSLPINFVHQIDDPYYKLLDQYPEITTPSFTIKQPEHNVRHHIPTTGNPVQSKARRLDPEKLAVAKAELGKLVDLGVAYLGKSEWSSPLLVTSKPNGGWRVCGDYRRLNNMTTDDRYPVRTLQDFTAELHNKTIFSKIDLMKGYHQIPVADGDIPKTAVITPFGLYIFPRCPFGLKNAGQDFQRLMDAILGDLPRVYVYIDDILVASESVEQHLADLEQVFKTLSANGMVIQRSKCVLGVPSLEFLGYKVDDKGITPLPDRVEAIRATTPPTSVKELQRFLGMVGYYRRFMPRAANHLYHLFEALKGKPKTLNWTLECQQSFDATKEALAKAALLFHPRPGAQLALTTDASNLAVGGVLEQWGPLGWEPLAFYSSKLKENEKMWPPYDRELLGAFKGVRHFRNMIEGRVFTLYTDHQSLIPSLSKKSDPQTARQTYQLMCISEYTTDIRYVKGKANLVADALSRPNDELLEVNAIHQVAPQQQPQLEPNYNSSSASNNSNSSQSKTATISTNIPTIPSDSESEAPTTPSSTEDPSSSSTKNKHRIASAAKQDAAVADLGCLVASIGDMGMDWEEVARQQPLDQDYRRFRDGERSGLNLKSIDIGRHNLIVDISNGFPRPFVPFASRRRVFDLIHGLGHPGVERTRQSVAARFVWPSMRQDVSKWARECLACQQAKVTRHVTPPIGDFEVPNRRFQHLNMDLVTMPVSNGYRYLLTAVDRFSRWPIAVQIANMTAESVLDAFAHGWIQHYGIPNTITTDRGTQFSSVLFKQLTKVWGIETSMTTSYHPEANGLVERFHRRLKESLIALGAETPDQWYWRLPCSLLAIRTTLKPDVGASPADMVYGEGLAVPGESLPSNPATDAELVRQRASALADVRLEVARLQPIQTSAHRRPTIHLPQDLQSCTHIFVRRGGFNPSLSSPYVGPFRVVSRNEQNFKIAVPGRANETVAIARVKPCYSAADDAQDAQPPSPPPAGRRPGPRTRQPNPRRNRPRRRQRSPSPPSASPQASRRASPQPSPPASPASSAASPPTPPEVEVKDTPTEWEVPEWFDVNARPDNDVDIPSFLDSPPRVSPDPPPPRQRDSWFSPDAPLSPQPQAPAATQAGLRPEMPRRRLFSDPPPAPPAPPTPPARDPRSPAWSKLTRDRRGRFKKQRKPPPLPPPAAPQQPAPEVPQRPQNAPTFSRGGPPSRPRPDVNALYNILRDHLDTPSSPPTYDDSFGDSRSLFPDFASPIKDSLSTGFEPESTKRQA